MRVKNEVRSLYWLRDRVRVRVLTENCGHNWLKPECMAVQVITVSCIWTTSKMLFCGELIKSGSTTIQRRKTRNVIIKGQ